MPAVSRGSATVSPVTNGVTARGWTPCRSATFCCPRRSLTRSLVAHEILHAACGYAHWAGMKLGRMDGSRLEWRRPVARTSRTEERLARVTENLTRQIYEGFNHHHIFVYRP